MSLETFSKKYCFLCKLQPKDVIALVCLGLATYLKLKGFDGFVDGTLTLIVGYYFGKRATGIDKGL